MNRRTFIGSLGAAIAAAKLAESNLAFAGDAAQIAFTFDDFNIFNGALLCAEQRNAAILAALRSHSDLKAAGFVAGKYISDETKRGFVKAWSDAGHIIGNHTYSHFYYHDTSFDVFSCDVLRGEAVVRDLRQFRKIFRFPYLKEGETAQKRDQMRAFLKSSGYTNGAVTIDASDWAVDARLAARLKREPKVDLAPYREFYLAHLWERAKYYDELARKAVGRSVKHTLLLHHNQINGLFFKDVLQMFADKGWRLISAETAFTDEIFKAEPQIVPAGESIVWALAKESGKFDKELRYPAEGDEYENPKMDKLGL